MADIMTSSSEAGYDVLAPNPDNKERKKAFKTPGEGEVRAFDTLDYDNNVPKNYIPEGFDTVEKFLERHIVTGKQIGRAHV